MKSEIWKPIQNYNGLYEISNLGNIKSLKKKKLNNTIIEEHLLKQHINDNLISKINLTPETATIQASKVNINGDEQTCDILLKSIVEENKKLKDNWNKLKEYIRKNIIYDDVGMKILDPSSLEDYIQELEQGSDSNEI